MTSVSIEQFANAHRFSHEAMASIFEIFIINEDYQYASQAANAAFSEMDNLESELSKYVENSDISRINSSAPNTSVNVSLETFRCLLVSMEMFEETNGTFDITVGTGQTESIKLDPDHLTVTRLDENVELDLGGIGKGFAVEKIFELLKEWKIHNALIHGGQSTVFAFRESDRENDWPITLNHPAENKKIISKLNLNYNAISGSGIEKGDHIIDPRTKKPIENTIAAWAMNPSATKADALSTAFMIMSPDEIKKCCEKNPQTGAAVIYKTKNEKSRVEYFGCWEKTRTI